MPRFSRESERPIMSPSLASSKRSSLHLSVYSTSNSFTFSDRNSFSSDTATALAEIKQLAQGLARLENKHLSQQRYIVSAEKSDNLSKLALGAKVERALGRRMTDQDAVRKIRKPEPGMNEKVIIVESTVSA